MHPHAMNYSRPAAQTLLACLGEESRFRLVQALIGGARCVTDLAAEVGLSQSCTTRHLQSLERRKLVSGRRDGKRVFYRIREDDPGLLALLGWALSDPKGAAGVRAWRLGARGFGSPGVGKPARAAPGPVSPATGAAPPPRPSAEVADRPRPESRQEISGSVSESWPPPSHPTSAPRHARRRGSSDIEDYLL